MALLGKIHQTRIKTELEATEKGVHKGHITYHNGRWLGTLYMDEIGEELKNNVLGNVSDNMRPENTESFLV